MTDMHGVMLGAWLRRMSAMIDADVGRVYKAQGLKFEQRWFGVINQLALNGAMSVSTLAEALRINQASVSETRRSLEKAGFIQSTPDPSDSRRRVLTLSPEGTALVARMRPMWDIFDEVALQIDTEAGQVTRKLEQLEKALQRKSLYARITERLDP
ncbi:MarR family winged helix-turn-helix transcriptional regulator [Paremcibacter congregatus]|uniref:MarR family winged helix-turn-helix transcriptional regulator n=1 Tax=Paremcibacter congregatus TaxID=2043170 RepID=UPI003A911916